MRKCKAQIITFVIYGKVNIFPVISFVVKHFTNISVTSVLPFELGYFWKVNCFPSAIENVLVPLRCGLP